jgi:SAM-dependent methyltransferase
MCNLSCIEFGKKNLREECFKDKSIIEVGSMNVNGSLRSVVEAYGPKEYIGVDLQIGPGVNQICKVENLIEKFGKNRFDVIISTELMEHVDHWKRSIHNMKQILKPGGMIILTTRSIGFPYHGYPYDFWRYEISDISTIFSDFNIQILESDPECPGIFLLGVKGENFVENKNINLNLYSMILEKRASILSAKIHWSIIQTFLKFFVWLPKEDYFLARMLHYLNHPGDIIGLMFRRIRK